MNTYIMIIIADLLLSLTFVAQKKYQTIAGATIKASLVYNALSGATATVIYLVINRFKIEISLFSVIMATLFVILGLIYTIIGFKILESGNMSLYTLFLMSGGMIVPYIWGVAFLNEELTPARILGLIIIIVAIVISNSGVKKPDKKTLMLCIAVFFLNGFVSVTSKIHQVNTVSEYVTSSDFAFIAVVVRTIICATLMLSFGKKINVHMPDRFSIKKIMPIIVVASLADSISFVLQLVGAITLPATVLYPFITGGSVIVTSLAGVMVFKEKLTVRQWIGVAICFVGTLLFL